MPEQTLNQVHFHSQFLCNFNQMLNKCNIGLALLLALQIFDVLYGCAQVMCGGGGRQMLR